MNLSTLPFSGFYQSIHSQIIDDQIDQLFQDDSGECDVPDQFWIECNYSGIFKAYSASYVELYQQYLIDDHIDIKLNYESLESPKQYNYTTDRIFINLSDLDLNKLYRYVLDNYKIELIQVIKNNFTSCDGFISFYSNDLKSWGDLNKWDHNQIGCLFSAIGDPDPILFYDNYEHIDNIIWENINEKCRNIVNNFYETRIAS